MGLLGDAGWRDLVCARCGGRVGEARCSTCSDARSRFAAEQMRSFLRWTAAGFAALFSLAIASEAGLLPH